MCEGSGERQVVRRIRPASDELEVHIDVVCTCKLKKICACQASGIMNGLALRCFGHNEHKGS